MICLSIIFLSNCKQCEELHLDDYSLSGAIFTYNAHIPYDKKSIAENVGFITGILKYLNGIALNKKVVLSTRINKRHFSEKLSFNYKGKKYKIVKVINDKKRNIALYYLDREIVDKLNKVVVLPDKYIKKKYLDNSSYVLIDEFNDRMILKTKVRDIPKKEIIFKKQYNNYIVAPGKIEGGDLGTPMVTKINKQEYLSGLIAVVGHYYNECINKKSSYFHILVSAYDIRRFLLEQNMSLDN